MNSSRRRPGVIAVIILGVVFVFLAGALVTPLLLYGSFLGGELPKATGKAGGFGSGCFVPDRFFTDTSLSQQADDVVAKLSGKYENARANERYIREVLAKGADEGINPAIPLAIWAGEQTFGSPEKAFGFGYTDSGTLEGVTGWTQQLNGVYSRVRLTLDNQAPYDKPAGANYFTRLFYSYTTAMRYVYENNNNSWNEEGTYKDGSKPVKNRLAIIRLIAPEQIECESPVLVAGATTINGDGRSTCPAVIQKPLTMTSEMNPGQGVPKVIILHYLAGSPPISVQRAYEYFNSINNNEVSADNKYVHYVIGKQGDTYQFFPENLIGAGAYGYNQPTKDYGAGALSLHIENEGHFELSNSDYHETDAQVQANVTLIKCLQAKYGISKENVISHGEAWRRAGSPAGHARSDPGTRFMNKVMERL